MLLAMGGLEGLFMDDGTVDVRDAKGCASLPGR